MLSQLKWNIKLSKNEDDEKYNHPGKIYFTLEKEKRKHENRIYYDNHTTML